jgi:hypothetical protein
MAHLGGALSEAGAERKFRRMVRLPRCLPYGEQPIILPDERGIVGYTGAGLFRFAKNEIEALLGRYRDEGDDEEESFSGLQLELNCGLVDDATNDGLGPLASWTVLVQWNSFSERHLFVRIKLPNHPAQSLASSLGFERLTELGDWEYRRLKPGELRKPTKDSAPPA